MSIKLKGSTAGSVALDAPANTSPSGSDIALILPIDAGSANQYLRNGSTAGQLEFGALDRVKRTYTSESSYTDGDTEIEFTGIPANFSRLRFIFRGLSLSGSNNLRLQIGHAASGGTYLTTGYDSYGNSLGASSISGGGNSTSFIMRMGSSNNVLAGFFEIYPNKATSPTRLFANHVAVNTNGSSTRFGAGRGPDISSVTIDRIKISPTGSNTFDNAGSSGVALITEVIE